MALEEFNNVAEQVGKTVLGYRLDKLLGSGSFGAVYSSFSHNSPAAVKISFDHKSAHNEVEILRKLHGASGIPQLKDFGEFGEFFIIVSQLGFQSLLQMRRKNNGYTFSRKTVQKILFKAITTLENIHRLGVCHQDLKDDNMLLSIPVTPNNTVDLLITDFGLSRSASINSGMDFSGIGSRGHDTPNTMRSQKHTEIDDLIQLSYSAFDMSTNHSAYSKYDFDECYQYKADLLRDPKNHLPQPMQWLKAFFEALGEREGTKLVEYDRIRESIQQAIGDSDASSALHLFYENFEYYLV